MVAFWRGQTFYEVTVMCRNLSEVFYELWAGMWCIIRQQESDSVSLWLWEVNASNQFTDRDLGLKTQKCKRPTQTYLLIDVLTDRTEWLPWLYCVCVSPGLLCHIDDACISNPCRAGSHCDTNPVNGKFNCNCPFGYKGNTCNDDINECTIGGFRLSLCLTPSACHFIFITSLVLLSVHLIVFLPLTHFRSLSQNVSHLQSIAPYADWGIFDLPMNSSQKDAEEIKLPVAHCFPFKEQSVNHLQHVCKFHRQEFQHVSLNWGKRMSCLQQIH